MKFDNQGSTIRVQMQKRLIAVGVVTVIAILYTTRLWSYVEGWIGLPRIAGTILFASVFLVYYFYHLLAASSFLSYSDSGGKIIVRHYQLNMFNTAKSSYEIPRAEFVGYAFEERFLGLRKDLILYRRHKGKSVAYPPISVSLLTPQEMGKLKKSLEAYGSMVS